MMGRTNRDGTMYGQLKHYSYILISIFVIIWLATAVSLFIQNNHFLQIQQKQTDANRLFRILNDTQDDLKSVIFFSDNEKHIEKYQKNASELKKAAEKIPGLYDSRNLLELQLRVETYLKNAEQTVELRERNLPASREFYEEAAYVSELIQEQYNGVFDELDFFLKQEIDSYHHEIILMTCILTAAAAAVMFGSFWYARYFSKKVSSPILKLAQAAEKVGRGERTPIGDTIDSSGEIQILAECFDHMILEIEKQMQELKEKGELEYQVLQAQINPHFLFNTLNMIRQLAFIGQTEQTMQAVELLSDLLRYGLANDKESTMIQEMKNAENYLKIQNMRYEHCIEFQKHIDLGIEQVPMPAMILQPLVENSVVHGMSRSKGRLVIGLDIQKRENHIRMCIYDTGKGMSQERIKILENLEKHTEEKETVPRSDKKQSMGLKNIYRRLRIFFDEDVNLKLKSIPYTYTEVVIEIPAARR
ncbi:MAG: sensor histidine kinase [Ruminococcus sp.]|jgi:two-component system sensor histidine kinase YesM